MSAPLSPPANPLSWPWRIFRVVTTLEVLVLAVAGAGVLLLPSVARPRWPWTLAPFNAGFLAAVYIASFVTILLLLLGSLERRQPLLVGLAMLTLFTLVVLLVSLGYLGRFTGPRWAVAAWFFLYVFIPLDGAYQLREARGQPVADSAWLGERWRALLLAQTVVIGLYGLAQLVIPARSTGFWPWPVDAFHARLYSAIFLTIALGSYLNRRAAEPMGVMLLAAGEATLGLFAIVALLAVDASHHRVAWSDAGTLVWLALCVLLLLCGGGLTLRAWSRRVTTTTPALRSA